MDFPFLFRVQWVADFLVFDHQQIRPLARFGLSKTSFGSGFIGHTLNMSTPFSAVVGTVRNDRTLEDLAREIQTFAGKLQHGETDSEANALDVMIADYHVTLAHRARRFQESAFPMQTLVRSGASTLTPMQAQAQQDGLSRGILPVSPDRGFIEGVMPLDLMPAMEPDA